MLENGLPPRDALSTAIETVRDIRFSKFLQKALNDLDQGATLTEALSDKTGRLPDRFLTLIQIGEDANRLAATAAHISGMAEREKKLADQVRSALIYPTILLVASVVVVLGLIFFLAPTLAPVFTAVQQEPPTTIQVFLVVGDFLKNHYLLAALGLAVVYIFLRLTPAWLKDLVSHLKHRIPVLGDYFQLRAAALTFNTISMMLGSGATLLAAIIAARDAAENPILRDLLSNCETMVREGGALSDALTDTKLLPKDAIAFIRIGERSNQLSQLLAAGAAEFESRLQRKVADLISLLTPMLTLVVGGLIGLLMFSTLSAVLEINEIAFQ